MQLVTLRFEGRVAGPWVAEARKACEKVLTEGLSLKLNLAEVEFLDPAAVALLFDVQSRGAVFVECSPFVEAQLKATASDPERGT